MYPQLSLIEVSATDASSVLTLQSGLFATLTDGRGGMEYIRKTVRNAAVGVGVADNPTNLSVLLKPGCAAAIWRRQTPPSVQSWLDLLDPDALPRAQVNLPQNAVAKTIRHICDASGLPDGKEREWLQDDIALLAGTFSGLMSAKHLRLRLETVKTDACREFHIDATTAQLVCTYRGIGTQYGISTDGREPKRVFTVPTGSPFLLRGTLWTGQPPSGLLHRSPPIEGSGETRLVLILDPVREPDQEA